MLIGVWGGRLDPDAHTACGFGHGRSHRHIAQAYGRAALLQRIYAGGVVGAESVGYDRREVETSPRGFEPLLPA